MIGRTFKEKPQRMAFYVRSHGVHGRYLNRGSQISLRIISWLRAAYWRHRSLWNFEALAQYNEATLRELFEMDL